MEASNKTIFEYLCEHKKAFGDDVLLFDEKNKYTVAETISYINALGNLFWANGLKKGDVVALRATRSLNATIYLLALQCMGIMTYLIDPHDSVFEIKEANVFITNEEEIKAGEDADNFSLYVGERRIRLNEMFADKADFEISKDTKKPTMVIFTSGSTGKSKGVLLSQYAFINNAIDTSELGDYRKDDVALCMIPIHHVFALALIYIGMVLKYAVFFPAAVDVEHLVECIDKYKITRVNGVPSLYKSIMRLKGDSVLESLRIGFIGGAPSTKDEILELEKALHMTMLPVYGMSECIGIACTSYKMDEDDRLSSVGRVYSLNEVILVDALGKEVPRGAEGEIRVKSPAMASGYLDGPLDMEDGYLKTGDLGIIDEKECLHVTGRIKDIIICNALNISSIKLEKTIEKIDGVVECAVIGLKDDIHGEIPCAFVVSNIQYTPEDIIEKCRASLAKYELPRKVVFLEKLPKTSTGKTDKNILKSYN